MAYNREVHKVTYHCQARQWAFRQFRHREIPAVSSFIAEARVSNAFGQCRGWKKMRASFPESQGVLAAKDAPSPLFTHA